MNGFDMLFELDNYSAQDIDELGKKLVPYGGHRINNAIHQIMGVMKSGYKNNSRDKTYDDNWDHRDGSSGPPEDVG